QSKQVSLQGSQAPGVIDMPPSIDPAAAGVGGAVVASGVSGRTGSGKGTPEPPPTTLDRVPSLASPPQRASAKSETRLTTSRRAFRPLEIPGIANLHTARLWLRRLASEVPEISPSEGGALCRPEGPAATLRGHAR